MNRLRLCARNRTAGALLTATLAIVAPQGAESPPAFKTQAGPDPAPTVHLANYQLGEGQKNSIVLKIVPLTEAISFTVWSEDETALAGRDFVGFTNELTFPPGTSSRSIPVTVRNDGDVQGERRFKLRFGPVSGPAILPQALTLVIYDNDWPRFVVLGPYSFSEADGLARFRVKRTSDSNATVVVRIPFTVDELLPDQASGAVPARRGVDFIPSEGTLEFGPGISEREVVVPLLENDVPDGTRAFSMIFEEAPAYQLQGAHTNKVDITSDEAIFGMTTNSVASLGIRRVTHLFKLKDGSAIGLGSTEDSGYEMRIFRVDPDGTVDTEFQGGAGFGVLDIEEGDLPPYLGWLDPQDRLLIFSSNQGRRLLRYLPSGDLDSSFLPQQSDSPQPNKVLFQSDGKIIVEDGNELYRLLENGSTDDSFTRRLGTGVLGLFSDDRLLISSGEVLLKDGTPDATISLPCIQFAAIDAWDQVYFSTCEQPEKLRRLKANGTLDQGFAPGFELQWDGLRREFDGKVSGGGNIDGRQTRIYFDEYGNFTEGPASPRIMEGSEAAIHLRGGTSWRGWGGYSNGSSYSPGGMVRSLFLSAVEDNLIIESAAWECGTGISEGPCSTVGWVPLGSRSALGAIGGQLIRVSINDRGASPRIAREHAVTLASSPRVVIWRGANLANETAVQCIILNIESSESFTNTAIFPAGESKVWLDLPEATAPGMYQVAIGTNAPASAPNLTVLDDRDLALGSFRIAPLASNQARVAVLYRGPLSSDAVLESSSDLRTWVPAVEPFLRDQVDSITLWTIPLSDAHRFFRLRGQFGLEAITTTQAASARPRPTGRHNSAQAASAERWRPGETAPLGFGDLKGRNHARSHRRAAPISPACRG